MASPLTPPLIAAAAALLVAMIAGAFSLFGLIISKEQEISRLRQSWIDSLRTDMAILVARAFQIQSYAKMSKSDDLTQRWEATRVDYVELNQASIRIKLRLNPDEPESKAILQLMAEMEQLFNELNDPNSCDRISSIVTGLESKTPVLLKKEWNRVKRGEPIFRFAKLGATTLFVGALIVIGYLIRRLL
jgi:hypothetical protein